MSKKIQQIAYLLLLLVFLTPSLIKLEHNHKRLICNAKNNHIHEHHDSCAVCDFEFSVFSSDEYHFKQTKEVAGENYQNTYKSVNYSNSLTLSFLLRAPPYKLL